MRAAQKERGPTFTASTLPNPSETLKVSRRLALVKENPDLAHRIALDLADILEREGVDPGAVGSELASLGWAR